MYLVVLFHAGVERFSGGYVGVDVFFVLSGFLVTQLLLRDLRANGSIRLRRFYSRRYRRLLPAAFVALIVTALVYTAIASPVEVASAVSGFKAAFLYATNWYFIHQSANYFAANSSASPVLHFWSLAVEEQFYLLWPLILGALFLIAARFRGRQWDIARAVVAAGALASVLWAWSLRAGNPNRAYYGTDTRAYQLLAGALIALTPGLVVRLGRFARSARLAAVVALIGLVVVSSSWVTFDAIERGTVVAVITMLIIATLEATQSGPAGWVLSTQPMAYLGRISYGTYLWHWPVIVVIGLAFHLSTVSTVALTVLVATALASLSFEMLERPVRLSALLDRHVNVVIAAGLATTVIAALVFIPAITHSGGTAAASGSDNGATSSFAAVPKLDWSTIANGFPPATNCFRKPVSACTLVKGTGPSIFLMGDSNAEMLIPAFVALAKAENLTLSVAVNLSCPWQRGLYAQPLVAAAQRLKGCQQAKDDTYARVIPALDPDVVFLMNQGYEVPGYSTYYLGPDKERLDATAPGFAAWLEQTTSASVTQLETGGRKVVLMEPVPRAPQGLNTVDCLSKAKVVAECRYVTTTAPSAVESLYRRLDKDDSHVWALDIDRLVCPYAPICDPIVGNHVVTTDGAHLTAPFAATLEPAIANYVRQNGILPG